MKQLLLAIILSSGLFAARAQETNLSIAMADRAYDNQEYTLAAHLYEKVEHYRFHKAPPDIPARLAKCYQEINDYANAARWYKKVTENPTCQVCDWLGYGDVLKSLGRYAEAKTAYAHIPDSVLGTRVAGCDSALVWMAAPTAYSVSNLASVNTSGSDWGAVSYGRGIVFTSDSGRFAPKGSIFSASGFSSGDPYQKVYVLDSGSVTGFSPVLNDKRYHDGAVTFNRAGDTAWFSVTNTGSLKDPGDKIQFQQNGKTVTIRIRRLELWWTARDSSGHWSTAQPFAYNNSSKYSIGQAAIDGPVLYFASDMPGGYGKTDIWYSLRQSDGSWGAPVNCGPAVNTAEEEGFPYVGPDGVLYFASKGHAGMGGFDVFKACGSLSAWTSVANLRYPLNSPGDDFYFTLRDSTAGYISSDRQGGRGGDDIYAFAVVPPAPPKPAAPPAPAVAVRNLAPATNASLPDSSDATDAPGSPGRAGLAVNTGRAGTPEPKRFILKTRVLDKLTGHPIAGAQIRLNGATAADYEEVTPGAGYLDSAFKDGFIADGKTITKDAKDTTTVTLYLEKKPEKGDVFVMNNVYFDFNQATIRADASIELDKVVAYMKQYPNVTIDL
ncbi:MAG TPA: hypothetical protein VL547_06660, partial [Dinghuibacter sp.]|nr:hypothetical protein [Dinghuibacter sp.]